MTLLIAGVLLWSAVHLLPAVLPNARTAVIEKIGENPYKGGFTLLIVIALLLIVFGWRAAAVKAVYVPPLYGSPAVGILMLISFVLFAAANAPGNTKRFIRHPMLTGLMIWGGTHLLANGDSRSIVLFGGLSVWALFEILLISRRDGVRVKPEPVSIAKDLITVAASAVVFAVVVYFHAGLFGVPATFGMGLPS